VEVKKVIRLAVAALIVSGMIYLLIMSYQNVREAQGSFALLMESYVLAAISTYLLVFLGLLVIRYAVLILYSFMEHFEVIKRGYPRYVERDESSLPMISLVVPAYNEGIVIQAALRSLLQLSYPNFEILVIDDGSTDDTYEKAMVVAQESSDISVRVVTKRNGGKAEALNDVGERGVRSQYGWRYQIDEQHLAGVCSAF
jgi:poly-beta-1,6-N-acetyl-D-glucosamine synthase